MHKKSSFFHSNFYNNFFITLAIVYISHRKTKNSLHKKYKKYIFGTTIITMAHSNIKTTRQFFYTTLFQKLNIQGQNIR